MVKPATELIYAEETDLEHLTRSLLQTTVIYRGSDAREALSKVDRIRRIDAIFDDPYLIDQLFRSGSIPELAEHVYLDRL